MTGGSRSGSVGQYTGIKDGVQTTLWSASKSDNGRHQSHGIKVRYGRQLFVSPFPPQMFLFGGSVIDRVNCFVVAQIKEDKPMRTWTGLSCRCEYDVRRTA